MHDVAPYTRVGRVADRENCVWASAIFERSGLTQAKMKAILTISEGSTILRGLTEICLKHHAKMTNRFEIEGLAVRQVQRHFANVCHVTLDARPSLNHFFFFCK